MSLCSICTLPSMPFVVVEGTKKGCNLTLILSPYELSDMGLYSERDVKITGYCYYHWRGNSYLIQIDPITIEGLTRTGCRPHNSSKPREVDLCEVRRCFIEDIQIVLSALSQPPPIFLQIVPPR